MDKKHFFHVQKRTLLAIAGCVWLLAGINVTRLGILSYQCMKTIQWYHPLLSTVIFILFGFMFFKMSLKHTKRIQNYPESTRPFWHFFDIKAYCIMAFMMGGGIWLRSSGLVPNTFIAVFYTGLGLALALAGIMFWIMFAKNFNTKKEKANI
ncbi:MAG: hypothetical protein Q4D37_10230 [Oscillospiraceae bacterium]|nr:hypothetical protein [Oscillospiraceae bacterium]